MRIFTLLFLFLLFTSCSNGEKKNEQLDLQKITEEAGAFIDSQFNFFYESSLGLAKNTFSNDAVLIGTDATEYYKGWDEMKPSIEGQLALENPKFNSRNRNIFLSSSGDMASYTQILEFSFEIDGVENTVRNVRSSGVIQKINGQWKVVQIHWSIGVQGQAIEY